jgi:dihydroxyacetone kinase
VASALGAAAEEWAAKAGGTSGVLWGEVLRALGARLSDDAESVTPQDVAAAVRAGLDALQRLGKAEVGDKTMVDAFVPFADTLRAQVEAGVPLRAAWEASAEVSDEAARATAALRPRLGRARPLAERSVGTPDAGAVSFALITRVVAGVLSV